MSSDPYLSSAGVYTDLQGLGKLKADAAKRSPAALRAAAKQFEALFIQMMLKSMRKAMPATGMFDSAQLRTYQDLFDKQISLDMANRNQLGLADMIVKQLGREMHMSSDSSSKVSPAKGAKVNPLPARGPINAVQAAGMSAPSAAEGAVASVQTRAAAGQTAAPAAADSLNAGSAARVAQTAPWDSAVPAESFDSPEQFVDTLWPYAQQAGNKLGVRPEALIAQAALETGWGQNMIRRADGSNSYNLFGIKAGKGWQGDRVYVSSVEYTNGTATRQVSPFRAYSSFAQSFNDYANFLQSHPRYAQALQKGSDPAAFIRALHDAGYATDPNYASKVLNILHHNLPAALKVASAAP